jgi:hypothetical protein
LTRKIDKTKTDLNRDKEKKQDKNGEKQNIEGK